MLQEGIVGLMEAIDCYNPERSNLYTHARYYIWNHAVEYLAANSRAMKVPRDVYQLGRRIENQRASAEQLNPTGQDLAQRWGLSQAEVRRSFRAMRLLRMQSCSYEMALKTIGREDCRPDDQAQQSEEAAIVRQVIGELSPRDQFIIERRFGLQDGRPQTLEAIAQTLGITREAVRLRIDRTLKKLSWKLAHVA